MIQDDKTKDKTWAMMCHLTALSAYLGIPFGNIIGPLIIWLIKKDDFPFVDDQGKESLNFQISITIYAILAGLLTFVFIGFLLLPIIFIGNIVLIILATVHSNKGEYYRYPYSIRFIK